MKFTVNSQTLTRELRILSKIIASKPTIPILSHVLLKAEDMLRLYATDLEVALRTSCAAQIEATGVVALPVVKLLAMCEQFPDQDVTIMQDQQHVHVTSGAFKSRLQTLPANDFPQLPEPEGVSSMLDAKEFRLLIDRTRYAIAETSSRYMLQGALLTLTETVAALCATDSKRLALATMNYSGAPACVIIPMKTLDILAMQHDIGDVEFTVGERHLFFTSGDRLLVSRMLDGKFPTYERVIPRDNPHIITVERAALMAVLQRVRIMSDQNEAIYIVLNGKTMELSSSSVEIGSANEMLSIGYAGPEMKICVDESFLLDFCRQALSQTLTIAFKDAESALLLTDGDQSIGVIMPMRI